MEDNTKKIGVATVPGYGTTVTVKLEMKNGIIFGCEAEGPKEYTDLARQALRELPKQIVEGNTLEVDSITGATVTCDAIIKAARLAYNEIMGDKDEIL